MLRARADGHVARPMCEVVSPRGASRSDTPWPSRTPCGFTLLEVLVALFVLSIGVLGLATLQTLALRLNTDTYYKSQATVLAYDLGERMRGNRQAALVGLYTPEFDGTLPDCDPGLTGGTPAQDLAAWRSAIACRLPLGEGRVTRDGNQFTITVRWVSRGQGQPERFELIAAL
jgi:type IV pilus assembly protein PilV